MLQNDHFKNLGNAMYNHRSNKNLVKQYHLTREGSPDPTAALNKSSATVLSGKDLFVAALSLLVDFVCAHFEEEEADPFVEFWLPSVSNVPATPSDFCSIHIMSLVFNRL